LRVRREHWEAADPAVAEHTWGEPQQMEAVWEREIQLDQDLFEQTFAEPVAAAAAAAAVSWHVEQLDVAGLVAAVGIAGAIEPDELGSCR
jgi:hypothetical protein